MCDIHPISSTRCQFPGAIHMVLARAACCKNVLRVQGCLGCTIAAAYVYWLLGNVAGQRYNLYSVFLMVPSGCLRALATKQLHVGVEDDDDDDDNERGMVEDAAAKVRMNAQAV
jgi:hypothetical protein